MTHSNGIHHVVRDNHKNGDKAYCGRVVWGCDSPIDLIHAKACIEQETYLQPCKKCIKAANKNQEAKL